jgi:predicted dienelactone hydrolase
MLALLSSLVPRSWRRAAGAGPAGAITASPVPSRGPRAKPLPLGPRRPQAPVWEAGGAITIAERSLVDYRRGKEVPFRVTFPTDGDFAFPIVVFSHGAWGTRADYPLLVQHWASHGYVCLQPSHGDSLMRPGDLPDTSKFREWSSRPLDVSFLLNALAEIEAEVPELAGRMDPTRVGAGGHSFGAGTAQILAGARLRNRPTQPFRDARVRAVLLWSPQGAGQLHDAGSWSRVRIPMLTITGTLDYGRGGGPAWRMEPFRGAPAGNKYLVVVEGGQHDLGGIGRTSTAFPYAHDEREAGIVQRVSLEFWDAYLKSAPASLAFLKGEGLGHFLGAQARLERK